MHEIISISFDMMMAEYQHEAKNLPPGWDCKYDVNTGKWCVGHSVVRQTN